MRQLGIYFNDTMAGILTEESPGGGYTFEYAESYLASDLPPVSAKLPKQKAPYHSAYLFPFFSNMLPEGANRRVICRARKIDEEDSFSLLAAMADKEFIGAVNIRNLKL